MRDKNEERLAPEETIVVEPRQDGVIDGTRTGGADAVTGVGTGQSAFAGARDLSDVEMQADTPRAGTPTGTAGTMHDPAASPEVNVGPIDRVEEGMKVVDAAGDEIGKVDGIRMGDPQSADLTESGTEPATVADSLTAVFAAGPEFPVTVRERLIRIGFIHVDGKGWIDTDRYVLANQIAAVGDDVVTLSVVKEELIEG